MGTYVRFKTQGPSLREVLTFFSVYHQAITVKTREKSPCASVRRRGKVALPKNAQSILFFLRRPASRETILPESNPTEVFPEPNQTGEREIPTLDSLAIWYNF